METATIFRIILPVLILSFAAHRGYYVRKHGEEKNTLKKRQEGWVSRIAGLLGMIGFAAIVIYSVKPDWLAGASLSLPLWPAGWVWLWHCWDLPCCSGHKIPWARTGAIPRA